jgi:chemotaxis methyl-accepting protein methylase
MFPLRHIVFEGAPCTVAPLLARRGGGVRDTEEEPEAHEFLLWLLRRAGLDQGAYRAAALQRRLSACLRLLRVPTPDAARDLLERRPELVSSALGAILIGVSHFFRDGPVFDSLETQVLPALLGTRARTRICSLGCSTGQELYSVAMLLAERGALGLCHLSGVDCRPEAIATAANGLFTAAEVVGVPPVRLAKFFTPATQGRWRIVPELVAAARWRRADLLAPDTETWDLILCRNVLIYLRPQSAAHVWRELAARLSPGGVLITGKAEKPPAGSPFTRIAPSTFLRRP